MRFLRKRTRHNEIDTWKKAKLVEIDQPVKKSLMLNVLILLQRARNTKEDLSMWGPKKYVPCRKKGFIGGFVAKVKKGCLLKKLDPFPKELHFLAITLCLTMQIQAEAKKQ